MTADRRTGLACSIFDLAAHIVRARADQITPAVRSAERRAGSMPAERSTSFVPRLTLGAQATTDALCALELPDFHLPPIQIGFVTLAQNEDMVPLQILRQAMSEIAGLGDGDSNA